MDDKLARERLEAGRFWLRKRANDDQRLWDYNVGEQDLPFAPEGVDEEYDELRKMSIAPWIGLVTRTGTQRQAVDGFRSNLTAKTKARKADDAARYRWQVNSLDARQKMVYTERAVFGRGLAAVWPRDGQPALIRPESHRRVHLEPLGDDPFVTDWSVKVWRSTEIQVGRGGRTRQVVV